MSQYVQDRRWRSLDCPNPADTTRPTFTTIVLCETDGASMGVNQEGETVQVAIKSGVEKALQVLKQVQPTPGYLRLTGTLTNAKLFLQFEYAFKSCLMKLFLVLRWHGLPTFMSSCVQWKESNVYPFGFGGHLLASIVAVHSKHDQSHQPLHFWLLHSSRFWFWCVFWKAINVFIVWKFFSYNLKSSKIILCIYNLLS